jgi:hypothetical protein
VREQRAFAVFVEIALALRVRVTVRDEFVATRGACFDERGTVIIKRRIDERARGQVERIEQFDAALRAHTIAILAPAVIEHIGLRRQRPERSAQPLAEREVFEVEAEIDREARAVRPAMSIAFVDRPIVEASMRLQRSEVVHCRV